MARAITPSESVEDFLDEAADDCGKDPLQNPLILSKIFGFMYDSLSMTKWRVLRSQCRLWHSLTLKEWRSRVALKLVPPVSSSSVPFRPSSLKGMPIDDFIKMFHPAFPTAGITNIELIRNEIPFKSFVLSGFDFRTKPDYLMCADHVAGNFWRILEEMSQNAGVADLESFTFENCRFPGDDLNLFYKILTEKLTSLRKLRFKKTVVTHVPNNEVIKVLPPGIDKISLTPNNLSLTYLEVDGEPPVNLFFLLMNSPKLETLVIRNYWTAHPFADLVTMSMVHDRRQRNYDPAQPILIKHLDVMDSAYFAYKTPQGILSDLRACNMPLETLTMTLECYEEEFSMGDDMPPDVQQILIPILQFHGETLQSLKIFRPPVHDACPRLGPFYNPEVSPLGALQELHIWGNLVGEFAFLSKVPNLRVLFIDPQCTDKADHIRELHIKDATRQERWEFRNKYRPRIGNFIRNTPRAIINEIHLESMESLHLNLTNFGVDDGEAIQTLARWMPNLKEFRGVFDNDTFQAVCQYMPDLELLGVLLPSTITDETITGRNLADDPAEVNPNNITALTKLKTFELMTPCDQGNLTDISVYCGFIRMRSLENLDISVSKTKFSILAERDVREQITNVKVVRTCNNRMPRDCCRDKAFHLEFLEVFDDADVMLDDLEEAENLLFVG